MKIFCKDLYWISEDIQKYSLFRNNYAYTKSLLLFLMQDILQIYVKKMFIKVFSVHIFENIQINIGSKNSPTLFFDILYNTTTIYEEV